MECRFCLSPSATKNIFDLNYVILKAYLSLLKDEHNRIRTLIILNEAFGNKNGNKNINKFFTNEVFRNKTGFETLSKNETLIKKDDGLAQMICNNCVRKISPMETFYKKCKEVDEYLRSKHTTVLLQYSSSIHQDSSSIHQDSSSTHQDSSDNEDSSVAYFIIKNENTVDSASTEIKLDNKIQIQLKTEKFQEINLKKQTNNVKNLKKNDHAILNLERNSNSKVQQKREPFKLVCSFCGLVLPTITLYAAHIQRHKGDVKCHICDFPYTSKLKLHDHMMKIHYCQHCNKYFKDKRPHDRTEHSNTFTPVFRDEDIVKIKKKPEDTISLCPVCGLVVKCIKKHMDLHSEASCKCNDCGKSFISKYRLQRHSKVHSIQCSYECDHCGNTYNTRHSLVSHIKGIHWRLYTISCPICGKRFNHRGYLKEHLMRHANDRKHVCDVCSSAFVTAKSLRKHQTSHSADRPHICAYCPKAFKNRDGCKIHEKIHKGEALHKCPVCVKSFVQKYNMRSHFKNNHKEFNFEEEEKRFRLSMDNTDNDL